MQPLPPLPPSPEKGPQAPPMILDDADEDEDEAVPALVLVATETTGFTKKLEMVQIAALCGDAEFDSYVLPTEPIDTRASAVNGLSVRDGVLHYKGEPQQCLSSSEAAQEFLDFLASVSVGAPGRQCVLVAHNMMQFHKRVIVSWMAEHGLSDALDERVREYRCTRSLHRDMRGKLATLAEEKLAGTEWEFVMRDRPTALDKCHVLRELLRRLNVVTGRGYQQDEP